MEAAEHPISYFFIGLGNETFTELAYLNDPSPDSFKHPKEKLRIRKNCAFYKYSDYETKEHFFNVLMGEF